MTPPAPLAGTQPCTGCGAARHPLVGKTPCPACGTVRWTLAVTGSRTLARHPHAVLDAARHGLIDLREPMGGWPALTLHGDAPGVDRLLAARLTAAGWTVRAISADWEGRGRQAGVLRDLALVARADALLAVWDGTGRRTHHLLQLAADRALPIAGALLRGPATSEPLPQLTNRVRPARLQRPATPTAAADERRSEPVQAALR